MFLEVAILVACVIGTFSALYAYVPFMKWSILYLFDVSAAPLSLLEMSWNWGSYWKIKRSRRFAPSPRAAP